MKKNIFPLAFAVTLWVTTMLQGAGWAQSRVDHSIFEPLLSAHVKNGLVDYKGFKEDEHRLDEYLEMLSRIDPDQLMKAERMAFYINAYNAWTIKLILTRYPDLKSIKDLGTLFKSPWKKKFVKLNGREVTLDHIEHEILRPVFKDPRIHFAVNCASMSCPPLLAEPYTGADLERQLEKVTEDFINDARSNYVEGGFLYVSRIFKWFNEDFDGDVSGFVKRYAKGSLAQDLQASNTALKVKYLDYDWSLNGS